MVVRAQTQEVIQGIGSTVRYAEGLDVGALRVWSCGRLEPKLAHLAPVPVNLLDLAGGRCVAYDAEAGDLLQGRGRRQWGGRVIHHPGGWGLILPTQGEAPDPQSRLADDVVGVFDVVQPVIAKSGLRREGRSWVRTSYHTHRQTIQPALHQAGVSEGELLVGDLLACVRVITALTRVHDYVAVILVVLVAARDHNRIRAGLRTACDPGLELAVNAGIV